MLCSSVARVWMQQCGRRAGAGVQVQECGRRAGAAVWQEGRCRRAGAVVRVQECGCSSVPGVIWRVCRCRWCHALFWGSGHIWTGSCPKFGFFICILGCTYQTALILLLCVGLFLSQVALEQAGPLHHPFSRAGDLFCLSSKLWWKVGKAPGATVPAIGGSAFVVSFTVVGPCMDQKQKLYVLPGISSTQAAEAVQP